MPTPAAVHMESLVAVLVPGGRGPSPVPIAKSSDGSPHAPPAEGRYTARPSPGGQQRRCAGRWLASRHAIIRGCHGRSADGRRARGRAIGTRAATHSDPPPLTLCSTLRARLHPLGEAARRRAGDRHLGRSEEKPPPRSCSKRGIQPSTAPERRRNRAVTTAGKAPTPANDDSQPRKSAPRLIRSLLASCLFAAALVHANGSFLLTAVLPGVPAVLASYHPPGLGEGEQTVR
jgi:hypothetical protein